MRLLLVAILAVLSQYSGAEGVVFRGYGFNNSGIYEFIVEPGNSANRWDSASKPLPLSANKAAIKASAFMKQIQADDGWKWNLSKVTLQQISKEPEEWVFVVNFIAGPDHPTSGISGFGAGIPRFDVVVQLDGKIPEPRVKTFRKAKGKKDP